MEASIFSIAKGVFTLYVVMVVIAIAISLINSLVQLLKKLIIKMREEYNKIIVALTFSAAKDGNDRKDDSPSSLSSSAVDMNMRETVARMEDLLCYRFKNKTLLQEALTHSSYADSSPSYQRLEFLGGGSALHFALAEYVFGSYPGLGPAQLSALREANIRTEKLARVAVRHKLHRYLRHKDPSLDAKVNEFVQAVKDEDGSITYCGLIEAPKILADIVESIAASVYLDCNHDLKALWEVFKRLMEPVVTLETLHEHTQPTTIQSEPMKMREGNEMDSRSSLSSMAAAIVTLDMKMREELAAVERLLCYRFRDKNLLQEALTHSSYTHSPSYQRLEFVGDAVLGLALAEYVFRSNHELVPGKLSLLREANVRTENLARVAVRHELYRYVRYKDKTLGANVKKFVLAAQGEDRSVTNCRSIKAPKILADIVESIAAAVYVDCNYDLKATWQVFKSLMEPIVTLQTLHKHSRPTTMLNELCQKQGKKVEIKAHEPKYSKMLPSMPKFFAYVFVDNKLIGSGSSKQTKKDARFNAANEALQKLLWEFEHLETENEDGHGSYQIKRAKQKLNELCQKKRWELPVYRIVREIGPPHERKFICSVEVDINDDTYHIRTGEIKSRVKDAENSAAFMLLQMLQNCDC